MSLRAVAALRLGLFHLDSIFVPSVVVRVTPGPQLHGSDVVTPCRTFQEPGPFLITYPIVPYKLNARVSLYGCPVGPSNIAVASREALEFCPDKPVGRDMLRPAFVLKRTGHKRTSGQPPSFADTGVKSL
jgi:hypothetical protein